MNAETRRHREDGEGDGRAAMAYGDGLMRVSVSVAVLLMAMVSACATRKTVTLVAVDEGTGRPVSGVSVEWVGMPAGRARIDLSAAEFPATDEQGRVVAPELRRDWLNMFTLRRDGYFDAGMTIGVAWDSALLYTPLQGNVPGEVVPVKDGKVVIPMRRSRVP